MEPAAIRLKRLRKRAGAFYTVRKVAEYVEMTPSSYAYYEDPKQFKKQYLPRELAMKLREALPFDIWEILELGGIDQFEEDGVLYRRPAPGEPTAAAFTPKPALQFVSMQVALPSEAALTKMFRALLAPMDQAISVDERAQTLARLLPNALASAVLALPAPAPGEESEGDRHLPDPAIAGRGILPAPRRSTRSENTPEGSQEN